MDKTDIRIPTDEELTAYMEESAVSANGAYEQSPVVLMVDDAAIGTLGNFSASIGKAKSKKTFNVTAIAASALKNGTVLKYRSSFPEDKRTVLYRTRTPSLPESIEKNPAPCRTPGGQESKQYAYAGFAQVRPSDTSGYSRTGYRHNPRPRTSDYRWHPRLSL